MYGHTFIFTHHLFYKSYVLISIFWKSENITVIEHIHIYAYIMYVNNIISYILIIYHIFYHVFIYISIQHQSMQLPTSCWGGGIGESQCCTSSRFSNSESERCWRVLGMFQGYVWKFFANILKMFYKILETGLKLEVEVKLWLQLVGKNWQTLPIEFVGLLWVGFLDLGQWIWSGWDILERVVKIKCNQFFVYNRIEKKPQSSYIVPFSFKTFSFNHPFVKGETKSPKKTDTEWCVPPVYWWRDSGIGTSWKILRL